VVCLRFSCVGVDGTFKFFWGGVTFFIIWVITGKITQAIVDNIYRKIKQKKFDEYLREGCLEMMEPTVGKNKEWILNDFRKIFSGFNKNEYEINNRDISCSFFIGIPEGTLEIKCKPYFNDNGICNDYDVWYIFYDHDGLVIPDGQLFSSRNQLLKKEQHNL
jgi:hypothetical protein